MNYDPTPKQEQAIRGWVEEAITPLIVQVLVKKLGQAMVFAKQEAGYVLMPDMPPECQTEAEKTAFAFGWFKALEMQRGEQK